MTKVRHEVRSAKQAAIWVQFVGNAGEVMVEHHWLLCATFDLRAFTFES